MTARIVERINPLRGDLVVRCQPAREHDLTPGTAESQLAVPAAPGGVVEVGNTVEPCELLALEVGLYRRAGH